MQIRLGGDMALFAGLGRLLLEADDHAPGTVVDRDFIAAHCANFEAYEANTRAVDLDTVVEATGVDRQQLHRVAAMLAASQRTVVCWAMGLTQHRHAVPTIAEISNVLLMRGMIGKPGAGLCPVRGHSNVQGDRTMGIWEQMPESFLAALDRRFGIVSPREHGLDTVNAIRAMRDGKAKVFMGMGGNFALATPDTAATASALRNCSLTVQVSTKLNRSHIVHGATALILPSLGRTDRDVQNGSNSKSPSKIQCRWCTCRGAACTRPATKCAARSPSSASWRARCSGRSTRCRGRCSTPTTTPSAMRSPTWCPAARTTTPECASPTVSSFRTHRATHANSPPAQAKPTSL
ncbi:molybdopterin oxidoreductase family protein [Mycobacterium xenopi 3993]|nr:molybdopterin oxidoreductase family protein [Mycobacterium xenopi 3993]